MIEPGLHAARALQQGWHSLGQQPLLTFSFSASACGLHLLGWSLFAAGHSSESAVLALVLHGVGVALYGGSLIWLVEGLIRLGLAQGSHRRLRWRQLARWHGLRSWILALGLVNTLLAAAAAALGGFMAWSLVVFLLPGLSILPALLAIAAVAAVLLSQLFNPCLVLDQQLSAGEAFGVGVSLLHHHWPDLLQLMALLLAVLAVPFGLGLIAEVLGAGLGVVVTALAMVAVLPLCSATVCAAYRQLRPAVR